MVLVNQLIESFNESKLNLIKEKKNRLIDKETFNGTQDNFGLAQKKLLDASEKLAQTEQTLAQTQKELSETREQVVEGETHLNNIKIELNKLNEKMVTLQMDCNKTKSFMAVKTLAPLLIALPILAVVFIMKKNIQ